MSVAAYAPGQRIAIVGSGISGLTCAYLLCRQHGVDVYEAGSELGGHTATKRVLFDGEEYRVDTGFIVFNDRTYPNFMALLKQLGVSSRPTEMGFSVSCARTGLEYSGTSLNGLFAQRKNLLRLDHWRLLAEILRFNRRCIETFVSEQYDAGMTLGDYLHRAGYSHRLRDYYILPMVSAIWSAGSVSAAEMPLQFFLRFFYNHGLLTVNDQPQWYTVSGGSSSYLAPLTAVFADRIHLATPVSSVHRLEAGVTLASSRFGERQYDHVVFACHSDQALAVLADASPQEKAVLSAMPYRENRVVLHNDAAQLPANTRAWASWNYRLPQAPDPEKALLTYNMNLLQGIEAPTTFCVSVNPDTLSPGARVFGEYRYAHPEFTLASVAAQARWGEISGRRGTHFCGAYWRNGFHEDGVVSALRVAARFGETL